MKPTIIELYNYYLESDFDIFLFFIYGGTLILFVTVFLACLEKKKKILMFGLYKIFLLTAFLVALLSFVIHTMTIDTYSEVKINSYSSGEFEPKIVQICEDLHKDVEKIDIETLYMCAKLNSEELFLDLNKIKKGIPIVSVNKNYNELFSDLLHKEALPFNKRKMDFLGINDINIPNLNKDFDKERILLFSENNKPYYKRLIKTISSEDLSDFEYVSFELKP